MKTINLKYAFLAGLIVYVIGITFFLGSYYYPMVEDLELQSNITISIVIIPASIFGARFYYRKISNTNGLLLGITMFAIAALLDAVITVPFFFMPAGGTHYEFFVNPWFWLVALEYVLSVFIYNQLRK